MTRMFGSVRINFTAGIIGLVVTFFLSYSSNLLSTSLLRAGLAFMVWFLLAFILRLVIGYILASPPEEGIVDSEEVVQEIRGAQVDVVASGDEDALKDILNYAQSEPSADKKNQTAVESGFEPLNPPKLVRTKDAEELAQAVRHLSGK
ncbi:hypothetical protein [Paenibacillus sp. Marseille-Q4541]|uniref:hypothetical protein n=1 Tax=Paenibacillus sp. Marseille-Q4541 TaxID=2831522 RepID=UPI001BAD5839|nr:hypothetical protein [Paenibacillus sp. Marseille-Q4541]